MQLKNIEKDGDTITFVFSNGKGMSVDFIPGMTAVEIIGKLRFLAKAIEREKV